MPTKKDYLKSITLFLLTVASTWYAGMQWSGHVVTTWAEAKAAMWRWDGGWNFAAPMMGILLAHELGHFIAGLRHKVAVSPPFFIPLPFVMFGTMGAVIRMREPIRERNALMDVAVAGPLCGLLVAIPVLIWGVMTSRVGPLPQGEGTSWLMEGHSLFYGWVLALCHGSIPQGHDILLNSTAMAGWAGLLVTMINLLPIGQLDGGHIAYALWGYRYNRISHMLVRALPWLALVIGMNEVRAAWIQGARGSQAVHQIFAGMHWMIWWAVLKFMMRADTENHPPTDPTLGPLTALRKRLGILTLGWFVLLFMPVWLKQMP